MAASLAMACGTTEAEKAPVAAAPAAVQIGQENVVAVEKGTIVVGPILSGVLRPQGDAKIRAELGGSMLEVHVEEGQTVTRGALLGRIETRTLDDARQSAASAVRNAESQLAVARREVERTEQLVKAGAIASRDLDLATSSVSAGEAQLADAKARLASAERQLGDAVIRAPIGGIVSMKAVNVGDVVSPGTELFTVIDPSSMRLEAAVPSEDLSQLRIGAAVQFTVRGYDQTFDGRIERIAPQADSTTRQVPLFVTIPNVGGRLVAGLFAEGRVVAQSASGLTVPVNAVNTSTQTPWVLRVTDGKTERVNVTLGLRDPRTERVLVASGLGESDTLLRGAAQGITPGTSVQLSGR
ncbi:MAG TPA: efflux RND transporter periplasmic adaptor subunit [Vicinamibacterales bacterium]|nr:efflux RND transporter periplasmic adaptor subunit [Vicinamibacterales bacterium]